MLKFLLVALVSLLFASTVHCQLSEMAALKATKHRFDVYRCGLDRSHAMSRETAKACAEADGMLCTGIRGSPMLCALRRNRQMQFEGFRRVCPEYMYYGDYSREDLQFCR